MNQLIIGITHADSLAAEAILKAIAEIDVEQESIRLFSSSETAGNRLAYGSRYIVTSDQSDAKFEDCGIVMQLEHDEALSQKIAQSGAILVKQGGHLCFFNQQDHAEIQLDFSQSVVDLVSTESYLLLKTLSAIQLNAEINAVQATILQPASYLDKAGVDELAKQTIDLLNARSVEHTIFPAQQAFNVIAKDVASPYASEISEQVKTNLSSDVNSVQVQSIQVPVFYGMTLIVTVQCDTELSQFQVEQDLTELNAVKVVSDHQSLVSPVTSLQEDAIASISQVCVNEQNVQFILTADHLRHGMAELFLNAMLVIRKTFL